VQVLQPLVQQLLQLLQQCFFSRNKSNRLKLLQQLLQLLQQLDWQPQAGSQAGAQQAGSQAGAQQAGSQQLPQPLLQPLLQHECESNRPNSPWKISGVRQQYCWQGVQHCPHEDWQPHAGSQAGAQQAGSHPQAGSQQLC
jgi:hypothetical protein